MKYDTMVHQRPMRIERGQYWLKALIDRLPWPNLSCAKMLFNLTRSIFFFFLFFGLGWVFGSQTYTG